VMSPGLTSYLKVVRDLYELSLNFTISHLRIIFNLNISKFLIVSSCSGNLDTSCFRALIIEDSASFLASVLDSFFSSSHYWGAFCQAAFVRVFFVLFPLGIYIEGKIVQNLRKRKNELLN
jgi:hypothetical protein